jgi:hypothetical protein
MILKGHLLLLHVSAPPSCPCCRPSSEISDKRLTKLMQDPRNTRRLPFLIIDSASRQNTLISRSNTLSIPASYDVIHTHWFTTLCMSSFLAHTKRISSIYPPNSGFTDSFSGTIVKVRSISLAGIELIVDDRDLCPVNR